MIEKLKLFAIWFFLGAGLLLSSLVIFHTIHIFLEFNLWQDKSFTKNIFILIISSSVFTGALAIAVIYLAQSKAVDSNALELHKFVEQSLVQIRSGLKAANNNIKNNQLEARNTFLLKHGVLRKEGSGIEFDIAVATKSQSGTKVGIYVAQSTIGKENSVAREQVSRIKFTVFVNQWQA